MLVEREKVLVVLQKHNGFEGDLTGDGPVFIGIPRLGRVFDFRVGDHLRRIQQSKLDGDVEFATERRVYIFHTEGAIFERGFGFVGIPVEELIDAGLQACHYGRFLVGEQMPRFDQEP